MSGFLAHDVYVNAKSGHTSPFTRDVWVVFRVFSGDETEAKGMAKTSLFPLRLAHSIEYHSTKTIAHQRCLGPHIWRYIPDRRNSRLFWFSRLASSQLILGICHNLSCPSSCRTYQAEPRISASRNVFFPSDMASLLPPPERVFQRRQNLARQGRI
jgi:hypothetical protein